MLTPKKFYTAGEEIFNSVTHGVGAALAIAGFVILIVESALYGDGWAMASSLVYGITLIILYVMSTLYHSFTGPRVKAVFRIFDHCTIYLLIAGTYTPVLLVGIRPVYPVLAWGIFGVQWGLTALAVVLNAIDLKKFRVIAMVLYLAMGWCIILAVKPMIVCTGWEAFWWILAGGVSYTIGAVLYGLGRTRRYCHSVFHLFVDLGSLLQAVGILCYVL